MTAHLRSNIAEFECSLSGLSKRGLGVTILFDGHLIYTGLGGSMVRIRSTNMSKSLTLLLVAASAPAFGSVALAEGNLFDQFPFAVACEYKGTQHAFYLSKVTADGTATYLASDNFAGTITLGGGAKAVGTEQGGSCLGKTVEELRESGQARDIRAN
ncbi:MULTISPECIES: hypothetical protein [Sinorhizobium/Ensifer group]|jgi:hypothetical protein|uniref:hypothetical protein n=1 Tax=Sinorhizobium/Ensifer group TaxID=227292 RepID=UPI0007256741|nr:MULTISPECIES: hypothetical protein [Sinorhizobium/Ensifer group]KSV79378.1 hypothetical protein N183_17710 [Sinorhizobium sp. Sb3]